ncbi:MAG: alpha/beta hydrolase fold domain-containing protein [Stenotrophobium sp.]
MLRFAAVLLVLFTAGCATQVGVPANEPPLRSDAAFTVQKNLVYTPAGWPQAQSADLYQPQGVGQFPAVVVVHGGGWIQGERSIMDGISKTLAAQGFVVLNIDYRLAPAYIFPAALQDVQQAVRWLRANAAEDHVDPTHIGAWGYSAGAELVALLGALSPGDPNFDAAARVQAVVAGGTPTDLRKYPDNGFVRKFIGYDFTDRPTPYRDASPIVFVSSDDPPMYLYQGTFDLTVYPVNAREMKKALDAANVPAELYLVHGLGHIGTFFLSGPVTEGVRFLDRYLR